MKRTQWGLVSGYTSPLSEMVCAEAATLTPQILIIENMQYIILLCTILGTPYYPIDTLFSHHPIGHAWEKIGRMDEYR